MTGLSSGSVCIVIIFCYFAKKRRLPFTVNKPSWDWSLVAEVLPNVSQGIKFSAEVALGN